MKYAHTDELRSLLDRYYAAETSADEERRLRELLSDPALPEVYAPDRDMMLSISAAAVPVGFEQRLSDKIDALTATPSAVPEHHVRSRLPWLGWSAAAAVGIIVVITAFTRLPSTTPAPQPLTPEETYRQVEMALMLFSETINKGYSALQAADVTVLNPTEDYHN